MSNVRVCLRYCAGISTPLAVLIGLSLSASVYAAPEVAGEVVSVDGSVFIRADSRDTGGARKLANAKPGDKVFSGDVVNTPSNGKVKILLKDKSVIDIGPSALFKMDQFSANGGSDRQADVSMMYGTMRASITQKIEGKGRFKVRTASATMGVRGTEFVVKTEIPEMNQLRAMVLGKAIPEAAPKLEEGKKAGEKAGEKGAAKKVSEAKTEITVLQGRVDVVKEAPKPKAGDEKSRAPASVPQVVSLTAGTQLTTKQNDIEPPKAIVLDAKTLTNLVKEVKVLDNTFSKAVSMDVSSSTSADSSSLHSALSSAVTAAPTDMIKLSDVGVAGTFTAESSFTQGQTQTGPVFKTLRITVRWVQ